MDNGDICMTHDGILLEAFVNFIWIGYDLILIWNYFQNISYFKWMDGTVYTFWRLGKNRLPQRKTCLAGFCQICIFSYCYWNFAQFNVTVLLVLTKKKIRRAIFSSIGTQGVGKLHDNNLHESRSCRAVFLLIF